jgi:endonuclease/exonuclease/phosphatase family metal-dependent hydrolase
MRSTLVATIALLAIFRFAGFFTEPRLAAKDIHRVAGAPRRVAPAASYNREPLRVVSWNIERGVHFDRVATTLRSFDADVILLQEVDRFCARSGSRDVASELAVSLGMNWVTAGEFQEVGEGRPGRAAITGQAVLSRYPIIDTSVIVFKEQAWFRWHFSPVQPRRGGRIALKVRTAGALVYNIHVESGGSDALRQRELDEVVADAAREHDPRIVIAGDFNNSSEARAKLLATLAAPNFIDALGNADGRQTSVHHSYPIDWIFTKGIRASGGQVDRLSNISDHYPLIARLSVD